MNIYSLSNEELADSLEVIARSEELKGHVLFGFSDDKKKEYPSRQFLQEAASRLARMKNEKPEEKDDKPAEETTPTEREVLKKSVVMLAEAVKDRSSSSAFDTCNKVLEMMRKLEK